MDYIITTEEKVTKVHYVKSATSEAEAEKFVLSSDSSNVVRVSEATKQFQPTVVRIVKLSESATVVDMERKVADAASN